MKRYGLREDQFARAALGFELKIILFIIAFCIQFL